MFFYLKIYGKLTGLANKFKPTMVFDTSEFEGPRFDCNNYAIATGDKNTNDKARLFKHMSGSMSNSNIAIQLRDVRLNVLTYICMIN
jgi:hypothetical protein